MSAQTVSPNLIHVSEIQIYDKLFRESNPRLAKGASGGYSPGIGGDIGTLSVADLTLESPLTLKNSYGILLKMGDADTMFMASLDSNESGLYVFRLVPFRYNFLTWLCCADLAPDDYMWSVECSTEGLTGLLEHPTVWVRELNEIFGPTPDNKPVVLEKSFNIQIVKDDKKRVAEGKVIIEGISSTGILRAVVSTEAAVRMARGVSRSLNKGRAMVSELPASPSTDPSDLPQYWDDVFDVLQGNIPTVICNSNGLGFGHIEIYGKSSSLILNNVGRAAWIATYLANRALDTPGYVGFLSKFPAWKTVDALPMGGSSSVESKVNVDRAHVDVDYVTGVNFSYASDENSVDECCDVQFGEISPRNPGGGVDFTIDSAVVKDYAE